MTTQGHLLDTDLLHPPAATTSSREQFPSKLYALLELADERGDLAVSWQPHGRAFRILDEAAFMRDAAPIYFRQTKIRSFYRQLNLWGYKRYVL